MIFVPAETTSLRGSLYIFGGLESVNETYQQYTNVIYSYNIDNGTVIFHLFSNSIIFFYLLSFFEFNPIFFYLILIY